MTRSLAGLAVAGALVAWTPQGLAARDKRGHVDGKWRDGAITIDGSPSEWPAGLTPFNDQPVSIAAVNDGDSLYIVLTASERAVRTQILRQGLIVWFDPGGKDKKHFGLKFPIGAGLDPEGYHGRGGHRGERPPDSSSSGTSGSDSAQGEHHGPPSDSDLEPPNRLEVLGASKDDARSFTADQAPGIAVKVGQAEGLLTYELKVPLVSNDAHPYAVGAPAGKLIGVGLEMPKLEMPEGEGRRGGGMGGMSGGMGGMGGGHGGGRGGGGGGGGGRGGGYGGGRPETSKPLNGWVTLQLAAQKATQ